ncbi:MAG: AbrB/MazE/SpoVT family DNA-binding domain-containing protein [Nanoarchaeota archaeon]
MARKWGNSLGIILPKELVEQEGIEADDKVVVEVRRARRVRDFFGLLPQWKVNTQKMKDELRKGWE